MSITFAPLFSGSSGNCLYLECGNTRLLVDAGVSAARIEAALRQIGVRPDQLDGILVTHEHSDHVQGIGVMSRRWRLPVYATDGTWEGMQAKTGRIAPQNIRHIEPDSGLFLGDFEIYAFSTPHDAIQPVGYTFGHGAVRFSVATDVGCVRDDWFSNVLGSDAVLLESNYDLGMLTAGPYPYPLKQRIKSRHGHLCNDDAADAAVRLLNSGTRQIVLGHLSKENNFPELALQCTSQSLEGAGAEIGRDVSLTVARRDGLTGVYRIDGEMTKL